MSSLAENTMPTVAEPSRDEWLTRRAGRCTTARPRPVGARRTDADGPQHLAALFAEYRRTGDRRVRNELVEAHRHVAAFDVKRYARRGVPADDLSQVALLAVVRAVDR